MLPRNARLWWMALVGIALLFLAPRAHAQTPIPCEPEQWQPLAQRLLTEGSLTLTLEEGEVNACLARYQPLLQRRTPFRAVQVDFRDGWVRVIADRTWFSMTFDLEPYVQEGQLRVRLRGARMGFIPLPRIFWGGREAEINAQLARLFQRPPFNRVAVQYLNITDQGMTVTLALRHATAP